MASEAEQLLNRYEALVRLGKIKGFSVAVQEDGLIITSADGSHDKVITLDHETHTSFQIFFHGVQAIQNDSFDYNSLKSLLNAKSILDRMLHNNASKE